MDLESVQLKETTGMSNGAATGGATNLVTGSAVTGSAVKKRLISIDPEGKSGYGTTGDATHVYGTNAGSTNPQVSFPSAAGSWPQSRGGSVMERQSVHSVILSRQEGINLGLQGYKSPLNYLLAFVPLGILAGRFHWNDFFVFMFNFLGCIPLATILGRATEDVAEHTNETVGGLLNATLGNFTELIISVMALHQGKLNIVRNTLVGSVLSNLLLVLGSSMLVGGLFFHTQHVLPAVVEANSLALGFAVVGFIIPALFNFTLPTDLDRVRRKAIKEGFSLVVAVCMLLAYVLFLIFQLKTHPEYFDEDGPDGETNPLLDVERSAVDTIPDTISDDDDDEPEPAPFNVAMTIMAVDALTVSWCSSYLVDTLDGFSRSVGLGPDFVAVFGLCIIGNAVEHWSAVSVAAKNRINLSVGIAVGSSVQIAMFATPLMVVLSWIVVPAGGAHLSMDMHHLDTICLILAVFMASLSLRDGSTNWLEGTMLVLVYFVCGAAFYFRGE